VVELHGLWIGGLVDLPILGRLNPPYRPERLALSALDFARIGAAAALEV